MGSLSRTGLAALLAASFAWPAAAGPLSFTPREQEAKFRVGADCWSVGQRVASQSGGQLARVSAQTRGGKTVCVVVVVVPGKGGQRPRRAEMVVPVD